MTLLLPIKVVRVSCSTFQLAEVTRKDKKLYNILSSIFIQSYQWPTVMYSKLQTSLLTLRIGRLGFCNNLKKNFLLFLGTMRLSNSWHYINLNTQFVGICRLLISGNQIYWDFSTQQNICYLSFTSFIIYVDIWWQFFNSYAWKLQKKEKHNLPLYMYIYEQKLGTNVVVTKWKIMWDDDLSDRTAQRWFKKISSGILFVSGQIEEA